MGQPPRRDDAGLPVFDADPATPTDRHASGAAPPGTRPGGARGVLPAVAVIVLLALGVGVGGMLDAPAGSSAPEAAPSADGAARLAPESLRPTPPPPGTPTPGPTPREAPAVTPAVACGPAPATAGEVRLTLTAPASEPVEGVADGTNAPTVAIPLGESATLSVVGDACARSWDVSVFDAETGRAFRADVVGNSTDDPSYLAQNRWRVWSTVGAFFLVAKLHFGPNVDVAKVWRIEGPGFTVPDTFLVAADGRRTAALPGCGLTFTLPNGYSVTDACNSSPVPDGLRRLRVPAWSRVLVDVPGWTVTFWSGSCGRLERDPMGFQTFAQPDNCALGAYEVQNGATTSVPVQFLARPGDLALQLQVRAMQGGTSYDATMYARLAGN